MTNRPENFYVGIVKPTRKTALLRHGKTRGKTRIIALSRHGKTQKTAQSSPRTTGKMFLNLLEKCLRESDQGNSNSFSQDSVINSIGEFRYRPEESTFAAYLGRFVDIFKEDYLTWPDEIKVQLLLYKFGATEHEKYSNYILPKNPGDISFRKTLFLLTKIFGERSSLFNTR